MDEIKENVRKILFKYIKNTDIKDEESLFENGIDSLTILLLLHEIETDFEIEIPDDELRISNFESIEQIVKFIKKMKGKKYE